MKATLHVAIQAKHIAEDVHAGQTRRDRRTPYIKHVHAVVEGVALLSAPDSVNNTHIAAAWLHDVLEDTDVTPDQLRADGITEDVIDAVVALTHQKGEMYSTYIERVAAHPVARVVKVADIMANMSDAPTRHQVQKYTQAMQTIANTPAPLPTPANREPLSRTSGPWHILRDSFWKDTRVIVNEDETIAVGQASFAGHSDTFDRCRPDEADGNAHMLAAAPTLYAALHNLVSRGLISTDGDHYDEAIEALSLATSPH